MKYVWKISVRWPVQVKHSFGLTVFLGENPNKKYTECVQSILIYYSEYVNIMIYVFYSCQVLMKKQENVPVLL